MHAFLTHELKLIWLRNLTPEEKISKVNLWKLISPQMSSNAVRYEEGYFLKVVIIVKTDFSFQCCIVPSSVQ